MEEWAAARREADRAVKKESMRVMMQTASSMDDDGGGREGIRDSMGEDGEGNGKVDKGEGDDLFEGIPVGIRAFMAQEKRLKQKHQREGTVG